MLVFTLCSNNYLAMACVLEESVRRHCPDAKFVLGLVDRRSPEIDYSPLARAEIIPVEDLGLDCLDEMMGRYSIVELNTALKPFFFRYLFNRDPSQQKLIYLDSDIQVFAPLDSILRELDGCEILLTPHLLSAWDSQLSYAPEQEAQFLKYGIYNMGFCGARRGNHSRQMFDWWCNRLREHCRLDTENGYFVDQLWMNHAPVFFEAVEVSRDPGLNVAHWNLHERRLSQNEKGDWQVNGEHPMGFYHFSSFQPGTVSGMGKHSKLFTLDNRPEMKPLFTQYGEQLKRLGHDRLIKIECVFSVERARRIAARKSRHYRENPASIFWAGVRRLLGRKGWQYLVRKMTTVP
jgi:hypothetical protein